MFDRQGSRKYLNSAERSAFLRVALREPNALLRAFCLTLFYTGCRISEALNLTVERFDMVGKALVFETLKRRRRGYFRAVPIPDELVSLLQDNLKDVAGSARVWPFSRATGYRLIKDCMAQAGIKGGMASPKGLRHGFGGACVAQKIPLTTLKKWLGHARLETTAIYLELVGDEERELAKRVWSGGPKKH